MPEMPAVPGPVMVIIPLFCGEADHAFRSVSINSKSFGTALQVNAVLCPGTELTRFQWMTKSDPAPLRGVMPSFERADTRKVLIVPGPEFRTLPLTVHPLAVRLPGTIAFEDGVGAAIAESKVKSAWNPV